VREAFVYDPGVTAVLAREIVPEEVIGPPVKPVPVEIEVTVPVPPPPPPPPEITHTPLAGMYV
jgi:hypothetical protein